MTAPSSVPPREQRPSPPSIREVRGCERRRRTRSLIKRSSTGRSCRARALSRRRAGEQAADDGALRCREDDRDRDRGDHRRKRELGPGPTQEHVRQADLDRVLGRVGQNDVGKEEVRPVGDEAEEEDERDERLGQGQRDSPERRPLPAAVDPGRLEERGGYRGRVVEVRQVDAEGEEREGQDDRERRPEQVERIQLEEDRSTSAVAGIVMAISVTPSSSLCPRNLPVARP